MSIRDKVLNVFKNNKYHGQTLTYTEIINLVPEIKKGSFQPSDYCYNLVNKGHVKTNGSLNLAALFKYKFEKAEYQVLGSDCSYQGEIYWKPKGKSDYIIVGLWEEGRKNPVITDKSFLR